MYKFIPKWSTLRGAGNSRFSRLTVLTPVLGYIILYLDFFQNIHSLSFNQSVASANLRDPTPIYMIYFGLCIFSVGVVIYQLLCSEIVKHYDNHISYIIVVAPNLSQFEYEHILMRIVTSSSTTDAIRSRADLLSKSVSLSQEISRENKVFALTEHYNLLNIDSCMGRLISSTLIGVGSSLILLPTIITFTSIVATLGR